MKAFETPRVLQCIHYIDKSPSMRTRAVKDYEFDLFIDGEREMYLDDRHYHLSAGSLVFRKPGQVVSSIGDYNAYMITLDFAKINKNQPEKYIRSNTTPLQPMMESDILDAVPAHFHPYHSEDMIRIYKKIMEVSYPNVINEELQERYALELIFLILADTYHPQKTYAQTHVERACGFINRNYKRAVSVDDIARSAALNKNYLIRLFKSELATTPGKYLVETRLFHARLLLIESQLSVKNIALSCGFNTPSYFIKCFREKFGNTPEKYRELERDL